MKTGVSNQSSAIGVWHPIMRSVLECGSALPPFLRQHPVRVSPKSAGAPAQSKTWRSTGAGVAALVSARLISWGRFAAWNIWSKVSRRLTTAATLAVLFAAFTLHAQPFAIDWHTIDGGGGGMSTNGAYEVSGTIGQPDAARSIGGNYTLEGGFWSIVAAIQTPGAPLLKVRRVGNTVEISWATADSTGFLLEETGSLAGTISWASVSTSATVVDTENVVIVTANTGYRFFRLRKP